jgi:hypothetical protein
MMKRVIAERQIYPAAKAELDEPLEATCPQPLKMETGRISIDRDYPESYRAPIVSESAFPDFASLIP